MCFIERLSSMEILQGTIQTEKDVHLMCNVQAEFYCNHVSQTSTSDVSRKIDPADSLRKTMHIECIKPRISRIFRAGKLLGIFGGLWKHFGTSSHPLGWDVFYLNLNLNHLVTRVLPEPEPRLLMPPLSGLKFLICNLQSPTCAGD